MSERWGRPQAALVPSPHADAIYLADLFRIGPRTWMIGGAGKSRAAALAATGDPAADLARDSVAIVREGGELFARYDRGALPADAAERERRHPLHRLDVIAYCLSQAETARAYADRPPAISTVDNKMLAWALSCQHYPAESTLLHFESLQIARLINRNLRVARFLHLTDAAVGTRFVVVPWMHTVEAKAALYAEYR